MLKGNRFTQLLAAPVGILGIYLSGVSLLTLYGALQARAGLVSLVSLPMLVVGVLLILYCWRALFGRAEDSGRHIAAIYTVAVLLYSDDLIEPLLSENELVVNPKVAASGASVVLAVIVYYGVKWMLNSMTRRAHTAPQAPPPRHQAPPDEPKREGDP